METAEAAAAESAPESMPEPEPSTEVAEVASTPAVEAAASATNGDGVEEDATEGGKEDEDTATPAEDAPAASERGRRCDVSTHINMYVRCEGERVS